MPALQRVAQSQKASLQRLHHLGLKLKHAFNARQPRVCLMDSPLNRGIADLLLKQGFLRSIQAGDDRGPFLDLIHSARRFQDQALARTSLQPRQLLSERQKERVAVLLNVRRTLIDWHQRLESPGTTRVFLDAPMKTRLAANKDAYQDQCLQQMEILPPVASVYIPPALLDSSDEKEELKTEEQKKEEQKKASTRPSDQLLDVITPTDLRHVTPHGDRRLWLDLKYNVYDSPALTEMRLISKGSRRVYVTANDLEAVLSGRTYQQWGATTLGAVTILQTDDGRLITVQEALKLGVGGEVLCVVR